jgi:hypothetical protein
MKSGPVDPDTYTTVNAIITAARRHGRDVVEELHRAGWLLTDAEDSRIRAEALSALLEKLHVMRPADFLRRRPGKWEQRSPMDLYSNMLEWLEEFISAVRKGN